MVEDNNIIDSKGRTGASIIRSGPTTSDTIGRKRVYIKASEGRGRKREEWVEWLYAELVDEFDRLRKLGVKFSPALLRTLAKDIVRNPDNETYHERSQGSCGKLIVDLIDDGWVRRFMEVKNIVVRTQTGKKSVSPLKQAFIDKSIAIHLGELKKGFEKGTYTEETMENFDETHFVIDMDNGKTLGFRGDEHVKYADVTSGGESMTMVVRLNVHNIERPFMIFKNRDRNYPMYGVPDEIPGVTYRTGPKGWMDRIVMAEYLGDQRNIRSLPNDETRHLFCDNCGGHNETAERDAMLQRIKTEMHFLPPNSTHCTQPADSFIISKIKTEWSKLWEEKKVEMIKEEQWQNNVRSNGNWSGKLRNPGKSYFLQLAADAVRRVNVMRDENNEKYSRKAMRLCGMALNNQGQWTVEMLGAELQEIVKKYPEHFNGSKTAWE